MNLSGTMREGGLSRRSGYHRSNFHHSPFIVFWETTQACDLVCKHCRASAQPDRHPDEIRGHLCDVLIEQLAQFPRKPTLILTGGDPMKRSDLFDIIRRSTNAGLTVAMTPSATPLVHGEALRRLKSAGLSRIAFSLDGVTAPTHDGIRGFSGSFDQTIELIRQAREIGLPVQINTTISRRNVNEVDAIARFLSDLNITLWSVFFLIPVGRGANEERIEPAKYEEVFGSLWYHAQTKPYAIKTTEAPHYRRFVIQNGGNPRAGAAAKGANCGGVLQRAPLGLNDGNGCMFISHRGEIFPSGFLPVEAGRFPRDSVVSVYQNAPIFKALRNPDAFRGKCGRCEYRRVCGGSRARAFAVTGDYLAAEPDCLYESSGKANPTLEAIEGGTRT